MGVWLIALEEYGFVQQGGELIDGGGNGPRTSETDTDLLSSSLIWSPANDEITSPKT